MRATIRDTKVASDVLDVDVGVLEKLGRRVLHCVVAKKINTQEVEK